jgi:hypothetical protein
MFCHLSAWVVPISIRLVVPIFLTVICSAGTVSPESVVYSFAFIDCAQS